MHEGGHSLLSKPAILENLNHGIFIQPFNPNNLKSCSYDVSLADVYWRRKRSAYTGVGLFNPYDPKAIKLHFEGPFYAEVASKVFDERIDHFVGIRPDQKVIIMEPGEMILGCTEEFIGGTKDRETGRCFTAEMKARSSIGRAGFEVCRCAGWGDVGYINRWTMEIVYTSPVPAILVAGTRIAQIKFYEVDPVDWQDLYGADPGRDNYQQAIDIDEIVRKWHPQMLLPKLKTD